MSGASLARRRIDQRWRWSYSAPGSWARRCGVLPALAALPLKVELAAPPGHSLNGSAELASLQLEDGGDRHCCRRVAKERRLRGRSRRESVLLCLALSVGGTWYSEWTFVRVRIRL